MISMAGITVSSGSIRLINLGLHFFCLIIDFKKMIRRCPDLLKISILRKIISGNTYTLIIVILFIHVYV